MLAVNKRKTLFLFIAIVLSLSVVLSFTSCSMNEEDGPRNITEKYFAAVKSGDVDAAIQCFTPAIQKQWEAALSLGSMFGKEMTGMGLDKSIFEGLMAGANAEAYKDCDFIVDNVEFTDDDHEHATVKVNIEGASDGMPSSTKVYTVLYDGEWYIEK